jgi:hypothetical protein
MKTCFKCNRELPLTEYYRHPEMSDGHLNKCKACTKRDTAENAARKSLDVQWVLSERRRHRDKAAKSRAAGCKHKPKPETRRKWDQANKVKKRAHGIVAAAVRSGRLVRQPCQVCQSRDVEAQHEDYTKPLDVMWFCPKHHGEHHAKQRDEAILTK